MKWTQEQINFLTEHYPQKGKEWCMRSMGMSEAQVRQKAARLKLRAQGVSDAWFNGQVKAAKSKVGKKRPAQSCVMKRLHSDGVLNLSFESRSKASKAGWLKNPNRKPPHFDVHPKGMKGKNHTSETKETIGIKSKKVWLQMSAGKKQERIVKSIQTRIANGTYATPRPNTTWKGGWREFGGVRKYYRSRWEANFGRYLQWLKEQGEIAEWKHEPKVFWFDGIRRGVVSYLPDFWVQEKNGKEVYYEVKGWMDKKSSTKLKRMKKYHPTVTVIVVAQKQYTAIAKSVSNIITGWE